MDNTIETRRLILRPWSEGDAEVLYKYARDPDVGTPAGWPPHTSVEFSRMVIREIFSAPQTYAVVLKATGEPIGCCGLVPRNSRHNDAIGPDDAEIGYWLGKPYWGRGIIPEAVKALIVYAHDTLEKKSLWIGFYDGNDKSRRVAEKCGFIPHHTVRTGTVTEHFYILH